MQANPYQQNQLVSESPRAIEHQVLARITGRMHAAQEKQDMQGLIEACYDNQKLWSIFMTDLANPANALPDQLKANLISIGLWVRRHTSQVMQGHASPESLINVNRNIMEGLAMSAANEDVSAITPLTQETPRNIVT